MPGISELPVAGIAGKVEDGVHVFRHGTFAGSGVGDVPFDELDAELVQMPGVRLCPIEGQDLPAIGHELTDQVQTEKARTAGDEGILHGTTKSLSP